MEKKSVAIDGILLRTLSSTGFPLSPDMQQDSFVWPLAVDLGISCMLIRASITNTRGKDWIWELCSHLSGPWRIRPSCLTSYTSACCLETLSVRWTKSQLDAVKHWMCARVGGILISHKLAACNPTRYVITMKRSQMAYSKHTFVQYSGETELSNWLALRDV